MPDQTTTLPTADRPTPQFEVHEHWFVSGPRSTAGYRNGKWTEPKFTHSHPGGGVPHRHPNTGPSFYGHRKPKVTKRPTGEQFELVAMTEEESSFELVITDSAINGAWDGRRIVKFPASDTPIEDIHMPAAERMKVGSRLKCIVRDERGKKPKRSA